VILGRAMGESMKKGVGDTIILGGSRFRVAGIYETGIGWEELGGVMTLRDAQVFTGRPRKVSMYAIKVRDPNHAAALVEKINQAYPDLHAALSGDFAEQMPDMESTNGMLAGISFLAIVVGGLGVMNTMLMAVMERTREIGVLRSVGWQRRDILRLILQESLMLALFGGLAGMALAPVLTFLMSLAPSIGDMLKPIWTVQIFMRAMGVALALGIVGGLYPAFRATRLQPIEALRYE
jgi:putative ABC transport system permease protein